MRTVVFDLGGVLVDWDPRYLLRSVMPGREEEMETILRDVLNRDWNLDRDRGDSWPDALDELTRTYPQWADIFVAFDARWGETLGGDHPETVAILAELREAGVPLLGLTNWSAEKYPEAERKFAWLDWFDDVVVSGRIGMVKPDAEIYEYLLRTHDLAPRDAFFTDDVETNVIGARALGIEAHHFTGAAGLRVALREAGFPLAA